MDRHTVIMAEARLTLCDNAPFKEKKQKQTKNKQNMQSALSYFLKQNIIKEPPRDGNDDSSSTAEL